MNYAEANEFIRSTFIPLIKERFIEVWGENTFSHNNTSDIEVYNSTNGNMYQYYMIITNGILKLPESVKYKRSFEQDKPEYNYISEMYNDLKETANPLKWMLEFIAPN